MPAHEQGPDDQVSIGQVLHALLPPLVLIFAVLGSILAGLATPTEAAGVGAIGALLLAVSRRELTYPRLREVMQEFIAGFDLFIAADGVLRRDVTACAETAAVE